MNKITLQTVVNALGHCDDVQEAVLLKYLNEGSVLSAGTALGEIVDSYVDSMEDDAEFDREHKLYLAARNLA